MGHAVVIQPMTRTAGKHYTESATGSMNKRQAMRAEGEVRGPG